jgi:hypothetical protein
VAENFQTVSYRRFSETWGRRRAAPGTKVGAGCLSLQFDSGRRYQGRGRQAPAAGRLRPRQAPITRLRRTTNAIKKMIAGKA